MSSSSSVSFPHFSLTLPLNCFQSPLIESQFIALLLRDTYAAHRRKHAQVVHPSGPVDVREFLCSADTSHASHVPWTKTADWSAFVSIRAPPIGRPGVETVAARSTPRYCIALAE